MTRRALGRSIPPRCGGAVQGAILDPVITFDAGQTLVELDNLLLARRLGERGIHVRPEALEQAAEVAWGCYDALVEGSHGHPWHAFMTRLLEGAAVHDPGPVVDWLWSEQPRQNLWRKPIPDMVDLARELAGRGVTVAVLSNSEGTLAELLTEIGLAAPFAAIVDSGRVGVAKPDRRIFEHALAACGATRGIHIGDSWSADVVGALAAGWQAIWFGGRSHAGRRGDDPRVPIAWSADDVRAALARFGV